MQAEKLSIPASEADQIIAAHDGDIALLWLCLRKNPDATLEDAARMLCRTRAEVEAALEKLQRMGLADLPNPTRAEPPAQPAVKLPPADELPQYTSRDIAARSKDDPRFIALIDEAQRVMGRLLSTSDMKKLFGLYDYLALPPEVLMMLLNYCAKITPANDPPSMRLIEKEGYVWANREIMTIEQADAYIADSERRREKLNETAKLLGITGRKLAPTEREYIGAWLDMGFDEELIELALDRTLTKTGGLKWGYMNGILKSWHEKGLHTPADVREKDTRRPGRRKGDPPRDLGKLLEELEKI